MATLRAVIDARKAKMGAAEFNKATASMKRSAGSATKSIERGFASAMRRIMVFGGAGGAAYMLKKFIDSASDAQETMNKFNVVFKEQRKEAAAWAEAFGDSVGRATQDVQKWMAGLQDLFVPLGFAREDAMGLSQDLTKLAVDVASFNNKADADVIRDFTSALVGNHETTRKYGIIISETALKQEAYNQGIKKTYSELTDLEKVHLRLSLIQKGTTDAQGDAIRSMDDYANQVKRTEANWTELKTILGGPAMDVLSDIYESVNENDEAIKEWAENAAGYARDIAEGFGIIYRPLKKIYDVLTFLEYMSPRTMVPKAVEALDEYVKGRFPEHETRYMPSGQPQMISDEDIWLKQLEQAGQNGGPSEEAKVKLNAEAQKQILADTREQLASVRSMHDMTRMEKIRMLDDYREAHFGHTEEIEAAEKLLNDEILALQNSRVNAMEVYNAELREDFEDSSLYISERFADTAHSIEGSMANSFSSMISDGASFKDAMTGFFRDVGRAFGQMASEMMARAIMMKTLGIVMGGSMPAPAGGFPGSSTAQSAMGNVFESGRVVPFANGAILNSPTYFPLADGKTGLMGEAGPEAVMPLRRGPGGRLGVEANESPQRIERPIHIHVKSVVFDDRRKAIIEQMKSEEGEHVIVSSILNSGLY